MADATVKARITSATVATLELSTVASFSGATEVAGVEGADSIWTFEATGLDADTDYFWRLKGTATSGKLRTPPTPGTAKSFTVAAASCAGGFAAEHVTGPSDTTNSPAFDRIRDRDPALFIHLGDFHYRDIATNDVGLYRTAYQDVMSNSRQAELYRNVPVAYVWDDHDYGPNDSDATSAGKPAAQQAYREYVPHYPLPADGRAGGDGEIYQTFVYGRVRFILLDVRSERTPNSATDDASKTMLGADQKQWLKDLLLSASEPVIVLAVNNPWIEPHADNWPNFSTERQELAEFFEDNALTSKLILLAADWHMLAADDGTNTQFDPGAAGNGPPLFQMAPLDASHTDHLGTYTEGVHKTSKQQYGTLEFTDDGSQIVVTGKGWSVDGPSEAEEFSLTMTFDGALAYSQEVLADSPTFYYEVEETSGTTASDSSDNANDGTYVGATLGATGQVGNAITLDGTDDYLQTIALGDVAKATVECWLKVANGVGSGTSTHLWGAVSNVGSEDIFEAYLNADGTVSVADRSGVNSEVGTSTAAIDDGAWHHLVVTMDAPGQEKKIYIDGSLDSTHTVDPTTAGTWGIGDVDFVFGARNVRGTVQDFTPMDLDEPAVYVGSVLSATRVSEHQSAGTA